MLHATCLSYAWRSVVVIGCLIAPSAAGLKGADVAATPDAVRDPTCGADAIRAKSFLFEELPTPSCHASTIVETKPGALMTAWFGGANEGQPDVGIWTSRLEAGSWTTPVEVADGVQSDGKRYPCWNPVLFQKPGGELLLFSKVGPSPRDWLGLVRSSSDGGLTWSEPVRLSRDGTAIRGGPVGPIKNKPVTVDGGVIIAPSSTEDDGWRVHFERSDDGGKTWQVIGPVNDDQAIEAIQPFQCDPPEYLLARWQVHRLA